MTVELRSQVIVVSHICSESDVGRLFPRQYSFPIRMWSLVVVCLAAAVSLATLNPAQEESVGILRNLLSHQSEQSKASPQFVLGVSIGLQLLGTSQLNMEPPIKQLIRQLHHLQNDYQKYCANNHGKRMIQGNVCDSD